MLAVVAIISVLASIFLPALARAKFQARNTQCKNNLRQIGIALQMYVTTYEAYPPLYVYLDVDGYLSYDWAQLLEPFLFPKRIVEPQDFRKGRRTVEKFFLCPFFAPVPPNMPFDTFALKVPLYGYNTLGVGWDGIRGHPSFGLASKNVLFDEPPVTHTVIRESAVLNPDKMIALGDPFGRSQVDGQDGLFQYSWDWRPNRITSCPYPDLIAKSPAATKVHRNLFNRYYCDGHLEVENFNLPFVATDEYLARWNNDYEPHREVWK